MRITKCAGAKQYISNHATNFQSRATIEPFTGLKIDLNADKNISENSSSYFRYITDTLADGTPFSEYKHNEEDLDILNHNNKPAPGA